MVVRGIEGMTVDELQAEVRNGGRFVIFVWTVSFVVLTFKQPTDVHFIRVGESSLSGAIGPSLISLVFGWWGIPWGPIHTIEAIAVNLSGGRDVTNDVLASIATVCSPGNRC